MGSDRGFQRLRVSVLLSLHEHLHRTDQVSADMDVNTKISDMTNLPVLVNNDKLTCRERVN